MRLSFPSSLRSVLTLAATLLALAWGAALGSIHIAGRSSIMDRLEGPLLDLRFGIAGPRSPPENIVLIALDDEAVGAVGRYPFPRATLAELVRAVGRHAPRVIAVDILFLDPGDPDGDAALARALHDARAVVAAAGIFGKAGTTAPSESSLPSHIPRLQSVLWPVRPIRDAAAVGLVNISADHGGTPRHVPLLMRLGDVLLPSFALSTAMRATRTEPEILRDRIRLAGTETATDLGANLPLRYYGPRGSLRTISAHRVLRDEIPDRELRGRVVVIGVTALGAGDTFNTPFDPILPGIEVLATAINHLLTGDALVRGPVVRRIDAVAALFIPPLTILLLATRRIGVGLILIVLLGAIWTILVFVAFTRGFWFSMSLPIAAFVPPVTLHVGTRLWVDRRVERQLDSVQNIFRQFQTPALGRLLAHAPEYLEKPVRRNAAILFIDLSGFTGASERLGPDQTGVLLKEFHRLIERGVHRNGGVVLSYLGDGAMILFGLLEAKTDDARRAIGTAVSLVLDVRGWLDGLSMNADRELGVRVGAHYGPVILSRLGGEEHQQITVAGDNVNIASRLLEVAAKHQASIAVSDSLYKAAGLELDSLEGATFSDPHHIRIRGRIEPLAIRFVWDKGWGFAQGAGDTAEG